MAERGMTLITVGGTDYTINDPNIADEFSAETAYVKGDYCTRQGNLYRFKADHAAGAWNYSHVDLIQVGSALKQVNTALGQMDSAFQAQMEQVDSAFQDNDLVRTDMTLSLTTGKCINNRTGAEVTSFENAKMTGPIAIDRAKRYYFTGTVYAYAGGVAYYDKNMVFISGQFGQEDSTRGTYEAAEMTIPATAMFFIASTQQTPTKALNLQTVMNVTGTLDFVTVERATDLLAGYFIDARTGKIETRPESFPNAEVSQNFIEVRDGCLYYWSGWQYEWLGGVVGYDKYKAFVGQISPAGKSENVLLTIPSNVKYLRCSTRDYTTNPPSIVEKSDIRNAIIAGFDTADSEVDETGYKMNHLYVATTGNDTTGTGTKINPFATIFHANEVIVNNSETNRYTIHVADGTYTDLQTRYANTVPTGYEGVQTKDYVYYEGNVDNPAACKIVWDGASGYASVDYENVCFYKCPFHVVGSKHTAIRGFQIEATNTRYALHIEMSGKGRAAEWEVSDCIFIWHGVPDCADRAATPPYCIGTGSGNFEKGHFARNKIVNDSGITGGWMNHDSENNYENAAVREGAEIILESCIFNGGAAGRTSVYFRNTNGDDVIDGFDRCSVKNCVGISTFGYMLGGESTVCKWRAEVKCSDITTNMFQTDGYMQ